MKLCDKAGDVGLELVAADENTFLCSPLLFPLLLLRRVSRKNKIYFIVDQEVASFMQ